MLLTDYVCYTISFPSLAFIKIVLCSVADANIIESINAFKAREQASEKKLLFIIKLFRWTSEETF